MKKVFLALILLIGIQDVRAQDLNAYQYVVIPTEFDFQKEPNQYQLNELLKFLFEREGFKAFLDNEAIPSELSSNACKGLRARVKNESGLFRTRLVIELKDCNNREVLKTQEGVSRDKEYQQAFHEALRAAFQSISELNYEYEAEDKVVEVTAVPRVQEDKEVKGEVEQELPVEEKDPVEVDGKKTIENDGVDAKRLLFQKDGSQFFLEKIPSGYNLYQKGMAEPFASLIKSSAGESFIYASVTAKGMANFDRNGNLTVEVLDPENKSLRTTVYHKLD